MGGFAIGLELLTGIMKILLFALLCIALYGLFVSMTGRRPRGYRHSLAYKRKDRRSLLHRLLLVPKPNHPSYLEKQRLLAGSGIRVEAGLYMAMMRLLACTAVLFCLFVSWSGSNLPGVFSPSERIVIYTVVLFILTVGAGNGLILEKLQQVRRFRVMRDIDVISRQLLYCSEYSANLHGKLTRCLPLAKALKDEWYLLTSEWYHNAEIALRRFRERVATEEGSGFAETLNALRQYDHDRYYELLKQRIADYKEKLELFKESRKESLSYLLYVMSGVPILYTFRLFVYPWVAEGQKLFDSLG